MTGYRQHSFDPDAHQRSAAPARPYNWVQWLGVALGSAGVLLGLADLAGRLGWAGLDFDPGAGAIVALCAAGIILINSRRQRRNSDSQGAN